MASSTESQGDAASATNAAAAIVPSQVRTPDSQRRRRPPRKRGNKKKTADVANKNENNVEGKRNEKSRTKKSRPKRNKKKFPWRRHIPQGTVDPITLDPLISLSYPPFALVATPPYEPVPIWPVPPNVNKKDNVQEEENRKRLQEQWGTEKLPIVENGPTEEKSTEPRHYHLYDGRALAYYLVSQLQFIDPLNRRDLTRDELTNLDLYLQRNGCRDIKVVEAFDANGVSVNKAGSAAHTAAGRAQIMQQEAQVLLNSLFGSGPAAVSTNRSNNTSAAEAGLRAQYQATQQQDYRERHSNSADVEHTINTSQEDGGLIVIDDDANPGLRGAGYSAAAATEQQSLDVHAPSFQPNTLWSASHITRRHGSHHAASVHRQEFPSLAETSGTASVNNTTTRDVTANNATTKSNGPSRSLQKITKVVSKTDPDEAQRQRKAREDAMHRAMLANMSFVPPGTMQPQNTTSTSFPGQDVMQPATGPTEGQLERNRAVAGALGVTPSTVRQDHNSGWARPTFTSVELDQFGNELNAAQYPESLLLAARTDFMGELIKLEKKWKAFLVDDKAASLPLKAMNRPLRAFVHEYSDFWKLHTESFDREPKRYIHCVKLRDTSAPYPLLSDAARSYRGSGGLGGVSSSSQSQAAGQSAREFPPAPPREPLKLLPKSGTTTAVSLRSAVDTSSTHELNSRFESLGRERIKLELAPRTIPAELPPWNSTKGAAAEDRLREKEQERARKLREQEEERLRILQGAFASSSDDEEEDSLSSGWEEEEALYSSSSEE